jgi:nucleoside 2-deoxyribosyltransferase
MEFLKNYGEVVDETAGWLGQDAKVAPEKIHDRDIAWLKDADILVAEVTNRSLGVGYEIGRAAALKKRILCLYHPKDSARPSSMIAGSSDLVFREYSNSEEAFRHIDLFLTK